MALPFFLDQGDLILECHRRESPRSIKGQRFISMALLFRSREFSRGTQGMASDGFQSRKVLGDRGPENVQADTIILMAKPVPHAPDVSPRLFGQRLPASTDGGFGDLQ